MARAKARIKSENDVNHQTKRREIKRKIIKQLANEIGQIPPIYDPRRRIRCELDPALWLRTYLPDVFFCEFSQSQIDFINQCWDAILQRGCKNINA